MGVCGCVFVCVYGVRVCKGVRYVFSVYVRYLTLFGFFRSWPRSAIQDFFFFLSAVTKMLFTLFQITAVYFHWFSISLHFIHLKHYIAIQITVVWDM